MYIIQKMKYIFGIYSERGGEKRGINQSENQGNGWSEVFRSRAKKNFCPLKKEGVKGGNFA